VNGKVTYLFNSRPMSHATVSAVNADIEVHLPAESNFDWNAQTMAGDVFTDLPIRGRWIGTAFRGGVNAPGGPTLTTMTIRGRVTVLSNGAALSAVHSVRAAIAGDEPPVVQPAAQLTINIPEHPGDLRLNTPYANISVGKIRGGALVQSGGGAINLGTVWGNCTATSQGGPMTFGDMMGNLIAHTTAGNIFVQAARVGGTITTESGSLRISYTGGPTTLRSGGGDIVVRQAAGPIEAETRSGDILVTIDPTQKTQRVGAHTTRGNIMLSVPSKFGAEVDATVITSSTDPDVIQSDFPGLQIRREQLPGGNMKVHATGRINGGGERLDLVAAEGNIHIARQ
jgi:hypothetical protein